MMSSEPMNASREGIVCCYARWYATFKSFILFFTHRFKTHADLLPFSLEAMIEGLAREKYRPGPSTPLVFDSRPHVHPDLPTHAFFAFLKPGHLWPCELRRGYVVGRRVRELLQLSSSMLAAPEISRA